MSTPITGRNITASHARVATLKLTVQAHAINSAKVQAIRMVYAEALLSGAGKYDRASWQHTLGNLGSSMDVDVDDGNIDFSLRTIDTSLTKTLSLFQLIFSSPHFSDKELLRIKTFLTNNLFLTKENAQMIAHQSFTQSVFQSSDRRYEYAIDTLIKEIQKVTLKDLQALHTSLWGYSWVYTTGGSAHSTILSEKTVKKVHALHVPTQHAPYKVPPNVADLGVRIHVHEVSNKQNIEFSIGGALPLTRDDGEYPAFVFGLSVLGIYGGFIGRLMSNVREKKGLTYGIYARAEEVTRTENGAWRIATFFSPTDTQKGIQATFQEIRDIQKHGITDDELKRFKIILSTRYTMTKDSLLKRVAEAHALQKIGVTESAQEAFMTALLHVEKAQVNEALKKYLNLKNCIISGAGPVKNVMKDLAKMKLVTYKK